MDADVTWVSLKNECLGWDDGKERRKELGLLVHVTVRLCGSTPHSSGTIIMCTADVKLAQIDTDGRPKENQSRCLSKTWKRSTLPHFPFLVFKYVLYVLLVLKEEHYLKLGEVSEILIVLLL